MSSSLVVIKHLGTVKDISKVKAHVKYIGFRSQEKGDNKGFFNNVKNNIQYKDFIKRIECNKALKHSESNKAHKLIFSLRQKDYEAYKRSGNDFKTLIRNTFKKYEDKNNIKLDWVANIHDANNHPHCHVVIKGVSDIKGDRGFKRIHFNIPKDFEEIKLDFEKEFNKDVQYKFFERNNVKDILKDMTRGFENVLNGLKNDINKEFAKNENERIYGSHYRNRFRDGIKEIEITEKDIDR